MVFDSGTWWLIGILLMVLISAIGVLSGRSIFGKIDEHTKAISKNANDIQAVQQDYTPRTEHVETLKELRAELKGDIKDVREELRSEISKLASDIGDIKENCLRKDDFIRATVEANSRAAATDRKIDKLAETILLKGGNPHG